MNRLPLTDRQQQIYQSICDFYEQNLFPPTIRNIAENYEMSIKGAHDHVKVLKKKGWLFNMSHLVPRDTIVSFDDYEGYLDK